MVLSMGVVTNGFALPRVISTIVAVQYISFGQQHNSIYEPPEELD